MDHHGLHMGGEYSDDGQDTAVFAFHDDPRSDGTVLNDGNYSIWPTSGTLNAISSPVMGGDPLGAGMFGMSPPLTGNGKGNGKSEAEIQQAKQKRRLSHNLVERRRRNLINHRIQELGLLLPFKYLNAEQQQQVVDVISQGIGHRRRRSGARKSVDMGIVDNLATPEDDMSPSADKDPHKGQILTGAVSWLKETLFMISVMFERQQRIAAELERRGLLDQTFKSLLFPVSDFERSLRPLVQEAIDRFVAMAGNETHPIMSRASPGANAARARAAATASVSGGAAMSVPSVGGPGSVFSTSPQSPFSAPANTATVRRRHRNSGSTGSITGPGSLWHGLSADAVSSASNNNAGVGGGLSQNIGSPISHIGGLNTGSPVASSFGSAPYFEGVGSPIGTQSWSASMSTHTGTNTHLRSPQMPGLSDSYGTSPASVFQAMTLQDDPLIGQVGDLQLINPHTPDGLTSFGTMDAASMAGSMGSKSQPPAWMSPNMSTRF